MQPDLSVVFVNYHSAEYLLRAVETLQRHPPAASTELLVVDNASGDRTALSVLCESARMRLLMLRRNRGYGAAANRGFRRARGRYLAVANPDIAVWPGTIDRLLSFMDQSPDVGVVSPQLLYSDGSPQPSARRFPRFRYVLAGRRSPLLKLLPGFRPAREFLYSGSENQAEPMDVDAVIGTFMLFRRAAFDEVGGFDEGYFFIAEDLDICRRLHALNWRVCLLPSARITHASGGVRRKYFAFTEYHRLRALLRFFSAGRSLPARFLLLFSFVSYLAVQEWLLALGLCGVEHSWRGRGGERRQP